MNRRKKSMNKVLSIFHHPKLGPLLLSLAGIAVFLLFWEGSVRYFQVKSYLLPAPSEVFSALFNSRGRIADHLLVTLTSMVSGYLLAIVVGIPLAMAIAGSRTFESSVYPLVIFLQILPKIAIAPLFIIWFGFGLAPKILLVFLLSFFPIVVAGVAGFKSVSPEILEFSRSTGVGPLKTFWKIRFPSAMPEIFTGLKVAAALASTAAVVAEFVAADRGLGYLLLVFNGEMLTPLVFADILVLGVLGLLLYYAVEVAQMIIMPWHVSARHDQTSRDSH
jgi:NitT/TauT family transport system permease protein